MAVVHDALGRFAVGTPTKGYRMRIERGRLQLVHRLRAQLALGEPLPTGAVVHHADGSKRDDAPLVICQNEMYHRLLHARMRIKAAGGDPNTQRICRTCGVVKSIDAFIPSAAAHNKWQCRGCPEKARQQRARGWGPEKARRQRESRQALRERRRLEALSRECPAS